MKVFKYELPLTHGRHVVSVPWGAKILSVNSQCGRLMAWALVSPDHEPVERTFFVAMTGSEIPPGVTAATPFVDTVLFDAGEFVLHVWDLGEGLRSKTPPPRV